MPITKSAKKSLKSSLAKRARNEKTKKNLEINLKKVSKNSLSQTVSLIDKAVKRGLIHKNKAARVKSQLAKKIGVKDIPKRQSAGSTAAKAPKKAPAKKVSTAKPKTTKKKA
jgi:small subunit ribosomal protein S20